VTRYHALLPHVLDTILLELLQLSSLSRVSGLIAVHGFAARLRLLAPTRNNTV
jgi:hypothetical protein